MKTKQIFGMERMPKIKVDDVVWVNEATIGGKPLKHEWYAKVISIDGLRVKIKDITGGSYNGETFSRWIMDLELKIR